MLTQDARQKDEGSSPRLRLMALTILLAFSILVLRLWHLQVIQGPEYASLADGNRLSDTQLKAPRGIIYGRDKSVVLADTRPTCDLVLVPADCHKPERVCQRLAHLIGIDGDELLARVQGSERKPFAQLPVKMDLSKTELMRVEEFSFSLPGIYTVIRPQRRYLQGDTGGQVLGYIGEVSREEVNSRGSILEQGDLIGRAGIESMYDQNLRGRDGQLVVSIYNRSEIQIRTDEFGNPVIERDSRGRTLREETGFRRDPVAGQAIHLTLDLGLQAKAEELLRDVRDVIAPPPEGPHPLVRGAIVVLHAGTGEVLAMASTPSYDPGVFVRNEPGVPVEVDGKETLVGRRSMLLTDPFRPMRNRAYQEVYPPGSIFKVMMAIAALEEDVVSEHSSHFCNGRFRLAGVKRPWRCWRHKYGGHGNADLVDALAYSCDVYFYSVGRDLGVDRINKWAEMMGLGIVTGLDLPTGVEERGLVPSTAWKKAQHPDGTPWERQWYPGETINVSIGQGQVSVTPLQAAVMMAVVVNGGNRVRPYLNKALGPDITPLPIQRETLDLVIKGMRKCVEKTKRPSAGTGVEARIEGKVVLGKTGTAQIIKLKEYPKGDESIPYKERDHAWFVAGTPEEDPPLAISIFVEHGLHGSSTCAPMAREIIEYFYAHIPEDLLVAQTESKEKAPNDAT
jgi:penicillin-binding protein 2